MNCNLNKFGCNGIINNSFTYNLKDTPLPLRKNISLLQGFLWTSFIKVTYCLEQKKFTNNPNSNTFTVCVSNRTFDFFFNTIVNILNMPLYSVEHLNCNI